MLSLREIFQGADPWVSVASTSLLVQSYQGLLRRLAYIALVFYWTQIVLKDTLLYTQLLTELLRSKTASGGETDDLGKHWTLNIADILLNLTYGEIAAYLFPGHKLICIAFATFLNLFVLRNHVIQLWTQTWVATLVRFNTNTWRWRDWIVDTASLWLIRKTDCQTTRTLSRPFWWILHKILMALCSRAVGDQITVYMLTQYYLRGYSEIGPTAKWAQRVMISRFFFQDLVRFTNPNPPDYKYKPLQHKEDIRVILLYPRLGFGKICCSLQQGPIMSALFYEAISYNWGTMNATEEILVDGCTMKVTKSVHEILSTYSSLILPKLLWVDAICIDQGNDAEKSQQVPLMERIYLNASITTVFLGRAPLAEYRGQFTPMPSSFPYRYDGLRPADEKIRLYFEDTQLTLDLLKEFHVLKGNALRGSNMDVYQLFETLKLSKRKQRQWAALLKMLQHPWFSRVWVIQEVALSSSVRLRYGDEVIDWDTLAAGIEKFDDARQFRIWLEVQHGVQLSNMQNSGLYNIERINQFRKRHRPRGFFDEYEGMFGETFDLSKVLAHGSYFQATNPRDLIFGLMSLCVKPVKVDYTHSIEDVYLDAAKQLVEDEAIGLLFHASGIGNRSTADPISLKLPSWVPNWKETPRYDRLQNQVSWQQTEFSAGGERKRAVHLRMNRSLGSSGYCLDTVAHIGPVLFDASRFPNRGTIDEMHHLSINYQTCVRLVEKSACIPNPYTYGSSTTSISDDAIIQSSLEDLRKTLFLDHKWISWRVRLLEFYQLLDKWEENLRFFRNRDEAQDMLISQKAVLYDMLKSMNHVTDKIRSCCGGRRFFVTSKGYMGLCPPYAQDGDRLYIVPGLHVPVLLRPEARRKDSLLGNNNNQEDRFSLVGECYVNGLMNGEGLTTGAVLEDLEIV